MQSVIFNYKGSIVPVFTPFNDDSNRTLNLSVIPQYAKYLAQKDISGVLVNGTTGEGTSMSVAERKLVAEAWAKAVKGTNQHLMIQVGGAPLPDVLELAKHAESIHANSILCLPELYFKPTSSEQLTDYLKLVADAAPKTPLLYYHIPMFTNITIHMGKFLESIGDKIPSFVGIKFTSANLDEGAQATNACNKKYAVFLGNDQLISAARIMGMDSIIATSLNMLPALIEDIVTACDLSDVKIARKRQEKLSNVVCAISKYGNWVETMKIAMAFLTTIKVGPVRAPLKVLPDQVKKSMAKDLTDLGYVLHD